MTNSKEKHFKSKLYLNIASKIFILGTSVIVIFAFVTYLYNYNLNLSQINNNIQKEARSLSKTLKIFINEKIKIINTIANADIVLDNLHKSNKFYTSLAPNKRNSFINNQNKFWMSIKNQNHPFIKKYKDNKAARWLSRQIKSSPKEFGEIFLTNKYGAVVATTSKLTTFKHSYKYWWKAAYNNGNGSIFIDDRGYDLSVGDYVIGIVVPVKENNKVIGILKANIKLLPFIKDLIKFRKIIDVSDILLIRQGGAIILGNDIQPLSKSVSTKIVKNLKSSNSGVIDTSESIIGFSNVNISDKSLQIKFGGSYKSIDHYFGNKGEPWFILVYKSKNYISNSLKKIIFIYISTGLILIVLLSLLSFYFGKRIAKYIAQIAYICKKISNGDFKIRAKINRNDEIGELAYSINKMAENLDETTASKKELLLEINKRKAVETQLRNILMLSPVVIYELEPFNFNIKWVSDNVVNILGFDVKEIKKPNFYVNQVNKNDRENLSKIREIFIKKKLTREYRFIKKNGEELYLSDNAVLVGNRIIGALTDITQKIELENRLRLLSTVALQSFVIIVITDKDGNIVYVNKAFEKVTGYSAKEAIGQNPRILKSFQHPKSFYEKLWDTILSGNIWEGEFINKKKDGTLYFEEANIFPIKNQKDEITHFAAIKKDITEKKALEEKLIDASKLESIGALSGAIAHDFNNILTIIIGNVEMALQFINSDRKLAEKSLQNILNASDRAAKLVSQLLAFSRKQPFYPNHINLIETINNFIALFKRLIPEDINFSFEYSEKDIVLYFDTLQLEQILTNLIVNARDAIYEANKKEKNITLKVSKIFICSNNIFNLKKGEYAKIEVIDSGKGMQKALIKKIFDPFFTTKKFDRGTGLGLSTVYGIVKQNKGAVNVISTYGVGSIFEIYLPVFNQDFQKNKDHPLELTKQVFEGKENILIVEDEHIVRVTIKESLEKFGYTVIDTSNGKEALEIYKNKKNKIDAIISDIIMPIMNGKEFYEQVKKINPEVKFLFLSGYPDNILQKMGIDINNINFIQKPVLSNVLAKKLRQLLDSQ